MEIAVAFFSGDIIYFQNNFRPFKMQVKESYTDVGSNRDATDDADREDKMDINLVVQVPNTITIYITRPLINNLPNA